MYYNCCNCFTFVSNFVISCTILFFCAPRGPLKADMFARQIKIKILSLMMTHIHLFQFFSFFKSWFLKCLYSIDNRLEWWCMIELWMCNNTFPNINQYQNCYFNDQLIVGKCISFPFERFCWWNFFYFFISLIRDHPFHDIFFHNCQLQHVSNILGKWQESDSISNLPTKNKD